MRDGLLELVLLLGLQDPGLQPGDRFRVPFPALPETLASEPSEMHVYIPSKYDPARKHPLFVWLNGGAGRPGVQTGPVGTEHVVVVSMPLYKVKEKGAVPVRDEDAELVWSCYAAMLAQLERLVPNLHPDARVIGGFSNGANTIASLLNRVPEFPRRFQGYLLWEGGNLLTNAKALAGESLFVVYGETSLGKQGLAIVDAAAKAGADADFLEMKGVGHATPPAFHPPIQEWIARKVLYKELPDRLRVLQDAVKTGRWPEAVRAYPRAADLLFDDRRPEAAEVRDAYEKIRAAGEQAVAKLPDAEPTAASLDTWKKFVREWTPFPCADRPRAACERMGEAAFRKVPAQPEAARAKALRKLADDWSGFSIRDKAMASLDEIAARELEAVLAKEKGGGLSSKLTKLAKDYDGTPSADRARQKLQELREEQAQALLERIKGLQGADRKRALAQFITQYEGTRRRGSSKDPVKIETRGETPAPPSRGGPGQGPLFFLISCNTITVNMSYYCHNDDA